MCTFHLTNWFFSSTFTHGNLRSYWLYVFSEMNEEIVARWLREILREWTMESVKADSQRKEHETQSSLCLFRNVGCLKNWIILGCVWNLFVSFNVLKLCWISFIMYLLGASYWYGKKITGVLESMHKYLINWWFIV